MYASIYLFKQILFRFNKHVRSKVMVNVEIDLDNLSPIIILFNLRKHDAKII